MKYFTTWNCKMSLGSILEERSIVCGRPCLSPTPPPPHPTPRSSRGGELTDIRSSIEIMLRVFF